MNKIIHVSLDFVKLSDSKLVEFADGIFTDMTGNASFASPPVALSVLQTATTALSDGVAAMVQGGKAATAAKNNARDALIVILRQLAGYVQENHGNDMAKLLTSGFNATNPVHAPIVLAIPQIIDIINGNSGQLLVTVKRDDKVKGIELRFATVIAGVVGAWQKGDMSTKSRKIPLNGLTPGVTYTVEARAYGGTTGYSDWSNAMTRMST